MSDSNNSSKGKTPLRARIREATDSVILDAAEAVLAESGSEGGGMNAIAARAGVSVGTLYNHFRDRDELVRALFADRRAAFLAHLDEAQAQVADDSFARQLESYVRAALGWFDSHRHFARLVLDVDAPRPSDDGRAHAVRSILERITRIVARGLAEGVLDEERSVHFPAILAGILKGVMGNHLLKSPERGAADLDKTVTTVVETFLHGAAVRPARTTR